MPSSPHTETAGDERYYQYAGKMRLARRISAVARRRVHELFLQTMQPQLADRILDVGTSDVIGVESNMLEQLYPHRDKLTCASLSDGQAILAAYPGVRHVSIAAGQPLPFRSNEFDIVYSNAVIEHAGSRDAQAALVREMCRVASRRFFVVPNRAFPIEHHTGLPLLHHLPQSWFRRLLRGTALDVWSHEENLNYVSIADLKSMWPEGNGPTVLRAGVGFGPWKSNLVAFQS